MKRLFLLLALGFFTVSANFAEAPVEGFYVDQNLQAAINPLGAQLGTQVFYRMPLIKEKGILWESTKLEIGLKNNFSPAYDLVGPFLDIEPIAIFDLFLSAQFAGYYKALGYGFRDLSGYGAAFDSTALDALPMKDATGYILSAAPTLKFAYGMFAFSNTFRVSYFNVDGGSGYFYEAGGNCPLSKGDIELSNDAYALVVLGSGFMVGLNDSILAVPASGYRTQKLHAIGIYSGSLSQKTSIYAALEAGIYLEDQYLQYTVHADGQVGIVTKL